MKNIFTKYEDVFPCGVKLPSVKIDKDHYDSLGISEDISNFDFLRRLCFEGTKRKGICNLQNKEEYYKRLSMELEVFKDLGFVDYVLLNWDVLNFCHRNNIPIGKGRGSAAGSLVLFVIGVTDIDPIKYDLFFERFVSKSRARKIEKNGEIFLDGSLLCDVDNDISYNRRQEVISYINQKFKGKTSKILTLNTLSSKLCIKECGKIVGEMPEASVNEISDSIPKRFGKVAKIADALNESEKFKNFALQNPNIISIAKKIEGLNKNTGVHPSGLSISYYDLIDIMPMQITGDGDLVSGYDMNNVAELAVKFDILGLRTLSVISEVCEKIGMNLADIDCDHPSIYAALQVLNAPSGLFQIEADTNYKVVQKVAPQNLKQLSAVVALARPGALDFVDRYAEFVRTGDFQSVHKFFDDVLGQTGGIPLFQEQLMKMAIKVGFNADEAEQLRRIVGKKKVSEVGAWKEKIAEKISSNNLDPKVGEVLWKVAEDSANYSFNLSHSVSYAHLAAATVYLKFNYPQEFFLSLLKFSQYEPNPFEEILKISQELPLFDIKLLPPDLTKSESDFCIEGKNIRYGLNSIKGVSSKVLESLLEFRENSFNNKYDIFLIAKQVGLNIGVLSSLIQAGVLDSFVTKGRCRLALEAQTFNILTDREKRLIASLGEKFDFDILNTIDHCVKNQTVGDNGKKIFSEKRFETFKTKYKPYKDIYDQNRRSVSLANWWFETKLLGYSYSQQIRNVFSDGTAGEFVSSIELTNLADNATVKFIGSVEDCISRTSANGNKYARFELSDERGKVIGLLSDSSREAKFSDFRRKNELPAKGSLVTIVGKKRDDFIMVDKICCLDDKIYMKLSELK